MEAYWDRYEMLPMPLFNPRLYSFICLKPIYPPTFSEESNTNSSMWEWAKPALPNQIILEHRLPNSNKGTSSTQLIRSPTWSWKLSTTTAAANGSARIKAFGSPYSRSTSTSFVKCQIDHTTDAQVNPSQGGRGGALGVGCGAVNRDWKHHHRQATWRWLSAGKYWLQRDEKRKIHDSWH